MKKKKRQESQFQKENPHLNLEQEKLEITQPPHPHLPPPHTKLRSWHSAQVSLELCAAQ